jgi:hypothetical protein
MIWCGIIRKRVLIPEDRSTWPAWVARHVGQCEECRRFVEGAARIRNMLSAERAAPADERAIARIMAEIHRRSVALEAAGERAPDYSGGWQPAWVFRLAVAAGLLMLLAVHFVDMPRLETPPREVAVEPVPPYEVPVVPRAVEPEPPALPMRPFAPRMPIIVHTRPQPAWPTTPGYLVTTSNARPDVEFGGLPAMPVSFDY